MPPTEASQKKSRPEAASVADQAAIDAALTSDDSHEADASEAAEEQHRPSSSLS